MAQTAEVMPYANVPKTERDVTVAEARAMGHSYRRAGELAGCSHQTAYVISERMKGWIDRRRAALEVKVLRNLDQPVDARLLDAANPESRTGPQSFLALLEVAKMRQERGGARVHIGDVNVGTIDGRSVTYVNLPTGDVRAEAGELLSGLLRGCETSGENSHGEGGADATEAAGAEVEPSA